MKHEFNETIVLDAKFLDNKDTQLRETSDGYLICMPRIARTGIQEYLGVEMGKPDMETIRVYRPEGEVFSKDALKTLAGKPVTIEHPNDHVNSQNWRDLAVGYIGNDVLRDGEFIRVPLHLMDAEAIKEVRSGRSQLSVGYSAVVEWGDGVTDKGEKYNATQTAIRANHVAITHTARGGPKLRMGDNDRRSQMLKKIFVDGIQVEMEERDVQVVEKRLGTLERELSAAQAALATAQTTAQTDAAKAATEVANAKAEVQNKDAEIVTMKKQLDDAKVSPDKLDQMADARVAVKQRAKALLDSVVLDKKTDAEIRRQVVNAKLGDVAKDWNDDMISASFNTLAVDTSVNHGNGLDRVINVVRNNDSNGVDDINKSYNQYATDISNRWKTAGSRNSA